MIVEISPKVQVIAQIMQRFSANELRQLMALVPALADFQLVTDDPLVTHFRMLGKAQRAGRSAQPDDLFIGGLTYAEYFGLSATEQDALWEQIFAESSLEMESIAEIELSAHVNVSPG